MKNKAVILGTNYYIGLSALRCLGVNGIHTVAIDYSKKETYGNKTKYCSERIIGPHYKEQKEEFVKFLINYAKKQNEKPVLIPCHDSYVEVIDEHLTELKKYYLIPQTETGLYSKLMNKEVLHRLAMEKGVNVPETVRVNEENFYEKIDSIIKYPCIVKPTDSPTFVAKFRRKLFKVHNREELEEALNKAKEANLEVIVQRIIPGFDDHMHTFDAYLDQNSKVTHWVTCQKHRQYPINFGASVYTEQKYVPELYDIGAKFLEEVGYKGFAEIEFKKDAETGKFYLIEINVRITNLNSLLYKVGVNFPYITYMELVGKPIEPKAIKTNTRRVFWYAYEDFLAIKGYIKTKQLTLNQVMLSFLKPKAYAIWDWKDPIPGISYVGIIVGKMLKKVFKRTK
ncbi:putative ATP-grasp superfamily ATP-dependent carboligase [Natranaerovirga pectinivora]|uniref:Putative ATP-grasp superfamily ATP-dependent carboligase n=1 Tax=Natranaerovirga pectinivora TaxID=682400 RepID=A0A4V2UZW6_9FIRM|nr:carboxylate--amine ligase [Natranaerovirga pectinivora]TCT12961.1 putative ATP-grasp superfamily ATP-dependent carboligase [Natranaerovirga pectinivora]